HTRWPRDWSSDVCSSDLSRPKITAMVTGMKMPAGVDVVWGGMFENLERARRRLGFIMPVTIAVIFGLLFWTFGSASDAAMVLCRSEERRVGGECGARWWA